MTQLCLVVLFFLILQMLLKNHIISHNIFLITLPKERKTLLLLHALKGFAVLFIGTYGRVCQRSTPTFASEALRPFVAAEGPHGSD